jgi:ABC-2 type transport system ATP-binding protein
MKKNYVIEVKGLLKEYPGKLIALDNIDLNIPKGSIFGLLGPNGAGKSTFINILAGLTNKSSGVIKVCGIDLDENPKTVRGSIGVVPQEINIDPFFTPIEILNLQAGFYGLRKKEMRNNQILQDINLFEKAQAYSRSLSGGMKRRLMVAKAMVHSPQVLILDEPTAGVDVELRKRLWNYVRKLNSNGTTIILTTHYLEEAEELCDNIAIINKGKVVACNTKEQLLDSIQIKEIYVEVKKMFTKVPVELKKYLVTKNNNNFTLRYKKNEINAGEIINIIKRNKLNIVELTTSETDLEEIFLKLLQK